jgi:DNA-binding PadR family transcriptional regulator
VARTTERITTPDLVVLSLLCEKPMHGYELNEELERRDVRDWADVSRPQVYYSLNKLERLGLLKRKSSKSESLGPERITFTTTARGRTALMSGLEGAHWAENRVVSPFVTWLSLCTFANKDSIGTMIKTRRTFIVKELKREKETIVYLKQYKDVRMPALVLGRSMVEFAIQTFEIELEWLDTLQNSIDQLLSEYKNWGDLTELFGTLKARDTK